MIQHNVPKWPHNLCITLSGIPAINVWKIDEQLRDERTLSTLNGVKNIGKPDDHVL